MPNVDNDEVDKNVNEDEKYWQKGSMVLNVVHFFALLQKSLEISVNF